MIPLEERAVTNNNYVENTLYVKIIHAHTTHINKQICMHTLIEIPLQSYYPNTLLSHMYFTKMMMEHN